MPENVHGLPAEEEKRLSELFNKIDRDNDGRIDIGDLSAALKTMNVPNVPGHAEEFMKHDADKDGKIDFAEFLHYIKEHEKKLQLYFKKVDINKDGTIDVAEIQESFKQLGVNIERSEAEKLLARMDKDGTLKVDWDEWRDYLILSPSANLTDILHYWRHSTEIFPCMGAPAVLQVTSILYVGRQIVASVCSFMDSVIKSDVRHQSFSLGKIIDIGENTIIPDDFTENEMKTGMWWRHLVAGGSAGAVSRTCTAPLDRLKVLLQVHGSKKNNLGIKSGFKQMLEEGGVKSLWRGNGINVIKIAPESAIKFLAYEEIKKLMKGKDGGEIQLWQRFLSGSLAGAVSQTAIYPMEVLKTRLALRKTGQYSGILDCAIKVYQHDGLRAFYRGYVPNIAGILPYAGIDLAIYETLKKLYSKRNKGKDPGIFALLACGTTSSTCGQLASYPFALIRTRLQAEASAEGKKKTMTSVFKKIMKDDGPRGLYRGLAPNFLKVAPAVSISYIVYEKSSKALGIKMS